VKATPGPTVLLPSLMAPMNLLQRRFAHRFKGSGRKPFPDGLGPVQPRFLWRLPLAPGAAVVPAWTNKSQVGGAAHYGARRKRSTSPHSTGTGPGGSFSSATDGTTDGGFRHLHPRRAPQTIDWVAIRPANFSQNGPMFSDFPRRSLENTGLIESIPDRTSRSHLASGPSS